MQKKGKLEHWQIIAMYLAVYDAIAVNAAYFLALWIDLIVGIQRFRRCIYHHI